MNFDEKYAFAMRELEQSSIFRGNYSPWFVQLIRKLKMQLPPPHYASFMGNTLMTGGMFSLLWGVMTYFFRWNDQPLAIGSMLIGAAVRGFCFGLAMACYYKYSAQKNQLTPWSEI